MLGRSLEIEYLKKSYEKMESEILILYGHKQVGKTFLLEQFSRNYPQHYYYARPSSDRQQRYLWGKQLEREQCNMEEFPSYADILKALLSKGNEKKIIVIDEFQNLLKASPDFLIEVTSFIKEERNTNGCLLILCSSYVDWVEHIMVPKLGNLLHEIAAVLKLGELGFKQLTEYFSYFPMKDAITTYSILGNSPGFWKFWSDRQSIAENICNNILVPSSPLLESSLGDLEEQLRETGVYYSILAALAQGKQKLNELFLHTQFSRAKISVYLKNLMDLEIVEKVNSIETEGKENTQKGIYRIKHKLIHFYFRFLYPNLSELSYLSPNVFYTTYIENHLESYTDTYFPDVCRETLMDLRERGGVPISFTQMGEWVGKAGNIPIVALDESKNCILGYCNFKRPAMAYTDFEWLQYCAEQAKLTPTYYYIFSSCGFDETLNTMARKQDEIILVDMY